MNTARLIGDLSSTDAARAQRAARALFRLKPEAEIPRLLRLAVGCRSGPAHLALEVLSGFPNGERFGGYFLPSLRSPDARIREKAALALRQFPATRAVPALMKCAGNDPSPGVRIWAIHALREACARNPRLAPRIAPIFRKAATHKDSRVRLAGYESLFSAVRVSDRKILEKAFRDPEPTISKVSAPLWEKLIKSKAY